MQTIRVIVRMVIAVMCTVSIAIGQDMGPSPALMAPNNAAVTDLESVNDPFEPVNRFFFGFNRLLDGILLKPISLIYRGLIAEPIRNGVANTLTNLNSPVTYVNDVLQAGAAQANTTLLRFVINSTMGILGIFDPATEMGIPGHYKDFDQSMGVWGMGSGPYLMLPILGPSTVRGVVGLTADYYSDPFNHYARNVKRRSLTYIRFGVDLIDRRSKLIETGEGLERTSLDLYATIRSIYSQRRAYAIKNVQEASSEQLGSESNNNQEAITESPRPEF